MTDGESVIQIESGHLTLGRSLQQYCHRHIERVVGRVLTTMTACAVHFKEEGIGFECTITMHVSGKDMAATARAKDTYTSFTVALAKLDKQLHKFKSATRDTKPARRPDKDGELAGQIHRWEPPHGEPA